MKSPFFIILIIILSFVLVIWSCHPQDDIIQNNYLQAHVSSNDNNLIKNGSFELWDSLGLPIGWEVLDRYNYTKMAMRYTKAESGIFSVEMIRECEGIHALQQIAVVEPNSFYFASVRVSGKIFDYSYGGLTIAAEDDSILGKHLVTDSTFVGFENILSVKFYTGKETRVKLILGFLDGMNADIFFDNCTLFKTEPQSTFSTCDQMLLSDCGISNFTSSNFDFNVQKIVARLDNLLIDGYKKFLRTGDSTYLSRSETARQKTISKYEACYSGSYFIESLHQPVTEIWRAYCQRSSLVASDVLSKINIATREIYFVDGDTGYHQFIEYWNPYKQAWILIDPFFGVVYKINGELTGMEELKKEIEQGVSLKEFIFRIPIDPFYYSYNDLVLGWDGRVDSQIYGDVKATLPF